MNDLANGDADLAFEQAFDLRLRGFRVIEEVGSTRFRKCYNDSLSVDQGFTLQYIMQHIVYREE
ncbi:hypothetical protein D3C87_1878710 [compost metagenome]